MSYQDMMAQMARTAAKLDRKIEQGTVASQDVALIVRTIRHLSGATVQ